MSSISYWVPTLISFLGEEGGAYLKGGTYYKFWALGGALIRSGCLFEAAGVNSSIYFI